MKATDCKTLLDHYKEIEKMDPAKLVAYCKYMARLHENHAGNIDAHVRKFDTLQARANQLQKQVDSLGEALDLEDALRKVASSIKRVKKNIEDSEEA